MERGYEAASMDEVARRAGVSKPVVYDHFGSKDGLFAACVERTGDALARAVAEAAATTSDPYQQLRVASLAFFEFIAAQHATWGALVDPEHGAGGPFAQHALRIRRRQSDMTAALLGASAEAAGVAVDPIRLGATAQALIGTYEALAIWWRDHPEVAADELTEWFLALIWPGLQVLLAAAGGPPRPAPA
ncbi:MAG: Transcriptional regulator, TetR family [Frankiales bacterium]|nr:Transcriptional regulator, TetR family [Frankiales bacterium]